MKIVEPSVKLITETDPYKKIEYCGRTCYASQGRIAEGTAKPFVDKILERGHTSVIEHANIVVKAMNAPTIENLRFLMRSYEQVAHLPSYIRNEQPGHSDEYFSGNARAWWSMLNTFPDEPILFFLFEIYPLFRDFCAQHSDHHSIQPINAMAEVVPETDMLSPVHRTITAEIVCSRGISHELVRHRLLSPTQMSTRYVKVDNLEVVRPWWYYDNEELGWQFQNAMYDAELYYSNYIDKGATPQIARGVLPNDTATTIILSGNLEAWQRFLDLRLHPAAHPDMQVIASLFKEETEKAGYFWAQS